MLFEGLEAKGLSHQIADFKLEADFRVARGERMVIQAPSGAGKTSLLRVIAGLENVDSGQVILDGQDLTRIAPHRRDIGIVFQEPALFGAMSVIENAAFALRMRGVGTRERREQAREWLRKVGLVERAESPVHLLSGGEKQRLAFVRALIWKPRLLLLDEPFSSLDEGLRQQLRKLLVTLVRETPVPMILVTHDHEDAAALATSRWGIAVERGLRRLERLL